MKIVLASNSPRRKEILSLAGYNFEVMASCYDENICGCIFSKELVENCAKQKALSIKITDSVIIGADTVVVLNNTILGKPKDRDEAYLMLSSLSNKTHFVATSICLIKNEKIIKDTEITNVAFRKLSPEEIISYINLKNPLDKAGSYGIQDEGFDFVSKVQGDIDNVVGFPVKLFEKMLKSL